MAGITPTNDVIAALSTPPGRSGVAVLRISGSEAGDVADRVFRFGPLPRSGEPELAPQTRSVSEMNGYTAAFGYVFDPERHRIIDEAVITRFKAPLSYTSEDVVEFSVHGSMVGTRALLKALYNAGARPAEAGEFTQRAFMNGKMDLTQAEAVMDLIDSEAQAAAEAALRQLGGAIGDRIQKIQQQGIELLSEIELSIQYPEHEDSNITRPEIMDRLQTMHADIGRLLDTREQGKILQEGLRAVLVGRPNAGKSSLLNSLSGEERAIVTDIPGTTRDLLEVKLQVHGLPVILQDTAGLRTTDDVIEQISIKRTEEALKQADLAVVMVDPGDLPSEEESREWLGHLAGSKYLIVASKSDLWAAEDWPEAFIDWAEAFSSESEGDACLAVSRISTLAPGGADAIWDLLKAYYEALAPDSGESVIVTSERQAAAMRSARETLAMVMNDALIPEDMIAGTLQAALEDVAAVTGTRITETMLDDLFSRFCVGK